MRRMADDLDFLENRLPQRAAARTSRQALADYYGTSPESAITNWRPPREAFVPNARSSARRAILSGRGGVGGGEPPQFTDSGDSMSSSDEEEVSSAFKPGMDNPEDFFQEVRVKTAHRKKRGASASSSLLGELIRRIDGTDDAAELLQWIDANAVPVPPVAGGPPVDIPLEGAPAEGGAGGIAAVAAATVEQLQRAFVHRFPLTGAQDRAEEALQKIKQRSKMLDHNRAYNKQMMRSSKSSFKFSVMASAQNHTHSHCSLTAGFGGAPAHSHSHSLAPPAQPLAQPLGHCPQPLGLLVHCRHSHFVVGHSHLLQPLAQPRATTTTLTATARDNHTHN